ncbi:gmc oxidoreductase [Moniliophthora roreri MCA 2997]|uniref:Gmc oxidoreductase n=1 Tax=Moniliophthora roreri (strain MCA 2997) TaxID=1381753 RepID=V2WWJ1_MONRO|nr:gmc oxidoreductase [Moniliophthora roreri MCA 2997]
MPIVTSAEAFIANEFDYIVVGGGTAGLVVAARLSEDPNVVVGVLEAGVKQDEDDPIINIPAMIGRGVGNPSYDWVTMTTPQPGANNRELLISRGKGLGGSSLINYLYMARPPKEEFDRLETLGNPGWNWDDVLRYMKKSEKLTPTNLPPAEAERFAIKTTPSAHGTSGPLEKFLGSNFTEFHADFIETVHKLGVPKNMDPNDGELNGVSTGFSSMDPKVAKRSYVTSAYFNPNASRPNLVVLTNAYARKVLLQDDATNAGLKQATGVEFLYDGAVTQVKAKREVILSAGAIESPRLLELSGIGNPELLSKYSIPTVIDLPSVGENLQDHAMVFAIAQTSKYETLDMLSDPEILKQHQALYAEKKGLLASSPTPAFVYMPASTFGSPAQVAAWKAELGNPANLIAAETPEAVKKGIIKQYELLEKTFTSSSAVHGEIAAVRGHLPTPAHQGTPGTRYITLPAFLSQPLSRGWVHITSSDPSVPSAVNPRYLTVDSDLDKFLGIFKLNFKLCKLPPLGKAMEDIVLPVIPKDASEQEVDRLLKEYIKDSVLPTFHSVGTAAMLPREDGGVVDSKLLVYGTSNLRVVDCSILPMELSTHLQATAYAIGEKAADIIKGTW